MKLILMSVLNGLCCFICNCYYIWEFVEINDLDKEKKKEIDKEHYRIYFLFLGLFYFINTVLFHKEDKEKKSSIWNKFLFLLFSANNIFYCLIQKYFIDLDFIYTEVANVIILYLVVAYDCYFYTTLMKKLLKSNSILSHIFWIFLYPSYLICTTTNNYKSEIKIKWSIDVYEYIFYLIYGYITFFYLESFLQSNIDTYKWIILSCLIFITLFSFNFSFLFYTLYCLIYVTKIALYYKILIIIFSYFLNSIIQTFFGYFINLKKYIEKDEELFIFFQKKCNKENILKSSLYGFLLFGLGDTNQHKCFGYIMKKANNNIIKTLISTLIKDITIIILIISINIYEEFKDIENKDVQFYCNILKFIIILYTITLLCIAWAFLGKIFYKSLPETNTIHIASKLDVYITIQRIISFIYCLSVLCYLLCEIYLKWKTFLNIPELEISPYREALISLGNMPIAITFLINSLS